MRNSLSALVVLITLATLGCQNATPPASQAMTPPDRAILISGNAGSTTIFIPSADPNNPVMLCSNPDAHACPECKAAAVKYFQTGVLDPKCLSTGAARTVITAVPPSSGHN